MEGEVDVAALQDELAREKAKNAVLMEQVLELEDGQADTDVEAFGDVIPNDERSRAFWRGQLIENRAEAIVELTRMRNRASAEPAKPAPAAPRPLHNRGEASKPAVAEKGSMGNVLGPTAARAAALRNRADQIAKAEKRSYVDAFRRAESELRA